MSHKAPSSGSVSGESSHEQTTITTPKGHSEASHPMMLRVLDWLEKIDTFDHVVIAIFLLSVALGVLIYTGISFGSALTTVFTHPATKVEDTPFLKASLSFLSDVLFVVIILEVLRTILNYLQSHSISLEPFLIIGIISGIRKILLVSATTSLVTIQVEEFKRSTIEEALSVISIVLLSFSMVMIRRFSAKT